jgi:hypothetical protein
MAAAVLYLWRPVKDRLTVTLVGQMTHVVIPETQLFQALDVSHYMDRAYLSRQMGFAEPQF